MKFQIDAINSLVGVDDDFRLVDLTGLDTNIAQLNFDSATGAGYMDYKNITPRRHFGKLMFDQLYSRYLLAWRAVGTAPERLPEEIATDNAAQARAIVDGKAMAAVKTDPVIQYLVSHTPAECAAYVHQEINANAVTTAAEVKTALIKLENIQANIGMALSVIARQSLRD